MSYPSFSVAESDLLSRIVVNRAFLNGKPIIREHRALEPALDMLAQAMTSTRSVAGYDWMEREDVLACVRFAEAAANSPALVDEGSFVRD
jgi:uncharacterized protein (DUF433 family)